MKLLKILGVVAVVYVAIVVTFESLIGYFQPEAGSTLVITTTDDEGSRSDRVLARLDSDGRLYVAANHWPRAWYREALARPAVQVRAAVEGGESGDYTATPVDDAERERLSAEQPLGPIVRFLTGFPPRRFLRLDPVS